MTRKELNESATAIVVDYRKIKELGGGSVKGFCDIYQLPYQQVYALHGKSHTRRNSKSADVFKKLTVLGCASVIDVQKEIP